MEKAIFGFIRREEKENKVQIPSSIAELCAHCFETLYGPEYFAKCGDDLTISGNRNERITKHREYERTNEAYAIEGDYNNIAYGSHWIDSTTPSIIRWTIKCVNRGTFDNGVIVGIISNEIEMDCDARWEEDGTPCYFLMDGHFYRDTVPVEESEVTEDIAFGQQDSILEVTLNLKEGSLAYSIDGKPYNYKLENIEQGSDIKYKLVISMWYSHQSFELDNFEFC